MKIEVGTPLSPEEAFKLALKQARSARGNTSPNPAVGCVIVDRNRCLLSMGHTQPVGYDHAEVNALSHLQDGVDISGAHIYVTLEPCAHEGRTPSCAKTLAKLPIASVNYGIKDPFPLVDGEGLKILEMAGIEVNQMRGFESQVEETMETFLHNQSQEMPFVALKAATSLDGQVALKSGESKWITSENSRQHVHCLRGLYDAVLVGVNTFLNDDPNLNVRFGPRKGKENKAIILDPKGRSLFHLEKSQLLKTHEPEEVIVVVGSEATSESSFANIVSVELVDGEFDLNTVLKELYARDICSVFVEGGGVTFSHFLKKKKFQRYYQYVAPSLLGAGGGISLTEQLSIESLEEKIKFSDVRFKRLGSDLFFSAKTAEEN